MHCNLDKAHYEGVGKYDIPLINPIDSIDTVDNWIGFNYAKNLKHGEDNSHNGVHFYLDDYQFEGLWTFTDRYLKQLSSYKYVLSPDFSLYSNYPFVIQLYNHYRKHWIARYLTEKGIIVVPSINWGDERSFEYCFDGEPQNSVVAVTDTGTRFKSDSREMFELGYNEMVDRLNPKKVIIFTRTDNFEPLEKLRGDKEYVNICRFGRKE